MAIETLARRSIPTAPQDALASNATPKASIAFGLGGPCCRSSSATTLSRRIFEKEAWQ